MKELTLAVTAREADLLRKLLVALRSVVRVREQYGDRTKPLDFETGARSGNGRSGTVSS
jgi:hypothetical protein